MNNMRSGIQKHKNVFVIKELSISKACYPGHRARVQASEKFNSKKMGDGNFSNLSWIPGQARNNVALLANLQNTKVLICIVLSFALCQQTAHPFSFFTRKSQTPEQQVERLLKKQEANPEDSVTNYNLGVAQYRAKKYSDASKNFDRVAQGTSANNDIKHRSLFNGGVSHLQNANSILPPSWETKKVDPGILDEVIQGVSHALDKLKEYLAIKPDDVKAAAAKNHAEELFKKLYEKKQQQEQQQKNEQNKDDNKSKDKDQQQDQQDQNQNKQKDQQQKQGQGQNNQSDESDNKEQVDKDQGEGDQSQGERDGKEDSRESNEQDTNGNDQESDQKKDKDSQKQEMNEDNAHDPQPSQDHPMQTEQENQDSEKFATQDDAQATEESTEMKGMRAILENLQTDEAMTQKRVLLKKSEQNKTATMGGQKPW